VARVVSGEAAGAKTGEVRGVRLRATITLPAPPLIAAAAALSAGAGGGRGSDSAAVDGWSGSGEVRCSSCAVEGRVAVSGGEVEAGDATAEVTGDTNGGEEAAEEASEEDTVVVAVVAVVGRGGGLVARLLLLLWLWL
jgi:hypothetical protein